MNVIGRSRAALDEPPFNALGSIVLFGDRVSAAELDVDVLRPETSFGGGVGLGQLLISAAAAGVLLERPSGTYLN